ncbi:hypothetical protein Vi05172_g7860 [Venturia inaequalis]|nr:hypothetical protein Vi05172_g7860 [Venturia inaequalis]
MQVSTYFTAIFMMFATFAAADVGCDPYYCDCVRKTGRGATECLNAHCSNTYPKGTNVPLCKPKN